MLTKFKVKSGLLVDSNGIEVSGSSSISGSTLISGSFSTRGNVTIVGSGSSVLSVDGFYGRLFSADDVISGSIYSISTIGGFPIMDVYHDSTIRMGQYGRKGLYISQSLVGIGKEGPLDANLDVSGSAKFTGTVVVTGSSLSSPAVSISNGGFRIGSTTGFNYDASNGNAAIGAAVSATYKLFVNGDIRTTTLVPNTIVFNNSNSSGTIILDGGSTGVSTGVGGLSTAPNNVFIGLYAGNSLSGSLNNSMVCIGYSAGGGITTGGLNSIFIGRNSGYGIKTGTSNIIIGSTDATDLPSNLNNSLHIIPGGYEGNFASRSLGTAASQIHAFIGGGYGPSLYMNHFYFGAGAFVVSSSFANLNFYAPSGIGTDLGGANFTINAGRGTGTGTSGDIILSTSTSTTSGTTTQTLSPRLTVKGNTGYVGIGTSSPSASLTIKKSGLALEVLDSFNNQKFAVTDNGSTGNSYIFLSRFDNTKDIFQVFFPSGTLTTSNVNWNFGMNANSNDFVIASYDGTSVVNRMRFGNTGLNAIGTQTPTAVFDITGSTTARASLRIRSGSAPSSPNDGDIWNDGTNLGVNIGGGTSYLTRGSGSAGQVTYWTGTSAVTGSSNFVWDNANSRLGIGTSSPAVNFHLNTSTAGNIFRLSGANNTSVNFTTDTSGRSSFEVLGNASATSAAGAYFTAQGYQEAWFNVVALGALTNNKYWRFGNVGLGGINNVFAIQKLNDAGNAVTFTSLAVQSATGNIGINTTAESNYRLDINGTGASTGALRVTGGNVQFGSATGLNWDNTNGRLGIGTSSPAAPIQIGTTSTSPFGSPLLFMGRDQNDESNFQISNSTSGTSASVGFRLFGANGRSTIIAEYSGGFTNTELAGHLTIIPNQPGGATKHGLIFAVTDNNSGSDIMFYTQGLTSANKKAQIFNATGNLTLQNGGTFTDSGYRLDVNGTGASTGALRVIGDSVITGSALSAKALTVTNGGVQFGSTTGFVWDATTSRLGIGAGASPSQTLQVHGTMRIGTTASNAMYWDDTYNLLGIGTSGPVETLDVRGAGRFVNQTNSSFGGSLYTGTKPTNWPFPSETNSSFRQAIIGQSSTSATTFPVLNVYGSMGIAGVGGSSTGGRVNIGVLGYQTFAQTMGGNTGNSGYGGYFLAKGTGYVTDFVGSYIGVYGEANIGTDISSFGNIYGGSFKAVGGPGQTIIGVASTITNFSSSTAYAYYANTFSSTNTWNLYMAGTANNYVGGNFGFQQTAPTAVADFGASTTTRSSLRIRSGSAPSTPNDGDIWHMSGSLYMQSGTTKKILTTDERPYGVFSSSTIQTASLANTDYVITFDTTEESNGVSIVSGSRMQVSSSGVYNLQFSTQLDNTSSGTQDVTIWLRKGVGNSASSDVARTSTDVTLVGNNAKQVAAWNLMLSLNANDYLELVWCTTTTNVRLYATGTRTTPTRPALPSVIASINKVS